MRKSSRSEETAFARKAREVADQLAVLENLAANGNPSVHHLISKSIGTGRPDLTRSSLGISTINPNYSLKSIADLGPLIRQSRKRMKMSQALFADHAGVGRRFLSELENAKPSLEFDKVLACARVAGIDILAQPRRRS